MKALLGRPRNHDYWVHTKMELNRMLVPTFAEDAEKSADHEQFPGVGGSVKIKTRDSSNAARLLVEGCV